MTPIELILMLGLQKGFKAVLPMLDKAGGGSALNQGEMSLIEKGVDILKEVLGRIEKERGTKCWFDTKIECKFSARPICGLKANWVSDKKSLADIQISDLENCVYRSDKQGA